MISLRIQILLLVSMFLCVLSIVRLLEKGKMDYKLGIIWAIVFSSIAGLALIPRTLSRIASFLGIASPVNMLFFLGFLFCAGIIFTLSRRISRLQLQVRRLAQEVAIANAAPPPSKAVSAPKTQKPQNVETCCSGEADLPSQ